MSQGTARPVEAISHLPCVFATAGQYCTFTATPSKLCAWGCGKNGRTGLGDEKSRSSPTEVTSFTGRPISSIASYAHTIVLTVDGCLWSFGDGQHGKLGLGDTRDRTLPCLVKNDLDVAKGKSVLQLSVSITHSAVLVIPQQ